MCVVFKVTIVGYLFHLYNITEFTCFEYLIEEAAK